MTDSLRRLSLASMEVAATRSLIVRRAAQGCAPRSRAAGAEEGASWEGCRSSVSPSDALFPVAGRRTTLDRQARQRRCAGVGSRDCEGAAGHGRV